MAISFLDLNIDGDYNSSDAGYDHYGLSVWTDDNGQDVAIAHSDVEALEAARNYWLEHLYEINDNFLSEQLSRFREDGVEGGLAQSIMRMKMVMIDTDLQEDINTILLSLIGLDNFDNFLEAIIARYGFRALSELDGDVRRFNDLSTDLQEALAYEYSLDANQAKEMRFFYLDD